MQYMGSKNKLSKELAPIIQSYITSETKGYLEPFVGGGNMIDKIDFDRKYGCDLHKELIALLQHIQKTTDDIPITVSEEDYKYIKENKNLYNDWYLGLIGFCCSYGSKYFDTYARGNDNRDRTSEAIRNIVKQSTRLKGIIFKHCSFLDIKPNISNFVIYCDPPYRQTAKYDVEEFPYEQFYDWCRMMSKNNIVLISEYNMPDDFECIWSKENRCLIYSNRNSNDESNNRTEKLFILKQEKENKIIYEF